MVFFIASEMKKSFFASFQLFELSPQRSADLMNNHGGVKKKTGKSYTFFKAPSYPPINKGLRTLLPIVFILSKFLHLVYNFLMTETPQYEEIVNVEAFMKEYKTLILKENPHKILQNDAGKTLGQMYSDLVLADKTINDIPFETFVYALNGFKLSDKNKVPTSLIIPEFILEYTVEELSALKEEVSEAVLVTPNTYFVKPGDSGSVILAERGILQNHPNFKAALDSLASVNNIQDWTKIQPGQQLYIPEAIRTGNLDALTHVNIHLVQPGETAYAILQNLGIRQGTDDYQKALVELEQLNNIKDWSRLSIGNEILLPDWIASYAQKEHSVNLKPTITKEAAQKELPKPKGTETLQLSNGITLEREGPMYFYVVQEGDTLSGIANKLAKQPRFAHLPEALKRSIVGFNIGAKNIEAGMRLPLPLAPEERQVSVSEMNRAATAAIDEMLKHKDYGPIVEAIIASKGDDALIKSIISIAEQESHLGKVALHRYEAASHHKIFSFGYHHILMSKTGLAACKRLGMSPGEACDPQKSCMIFLADLVEKAASRNDNLDPDKNYSAWKDHVLRYLIGTQRMPFTNKAEAESFASFYNGNWQKYNPNYASNILNYLHLKDGSRPTPAPETENKVFHTIQSGDNLSKIARNYGISLGKIMALNPDVAPRRLRVGQKIRVEGQSQAKTERKPDTRMAEAISMPQREKVTTHARAIEWRNIWKSNGISITSSAAGSTEDGLEDEPGRTYIPGVQERTMLGFLALVKAAPKVSNIQVNGIAETHGHAPGKTPQSHSHKNGFKIDFLTNQADGAALLAFIKSKDKNPGSCSSGRIYDFKHSGYEYRVIFGGSGHTTHADVAVVGPKKLTRDLLAMN